MTRLLDQRWHYRRSLASRVTLLTTMAVGMAVAVVALGAFVTVSTQMQASLDQSLLERARGAARTDALASLSGRVPSWVFGAADVQFAFVGADGSLVTGDPEGPTLALGKPELEVAQGEETKSLRTLIVDGESYRIVAVPSSDEQALVIAQSMDPQERTLRKLGVVLLGFGLAGVLASALAGWGVARNGLRPVRRLTASVEQIARTEQLVPLEVEGDDEIARLASAFNLMLAALDGSRERQRRLVADAGHELRTPLTSLRTNLDLLAQADEGAVGLPPDARQELLQDVRAQVEELTNLIGDLVELSRDDPLPALPETVDLAEVADRALNRVRLRASGIDFDTALEPWQVEGEEATLERAFTNLLDNAVKWSPEGGLITVRLSDGCLTVDDQGPGIASADLPHVFDRFYRSQDSRSMPGSGLGLSIVRQSVERHGGSVSAGAAPGGGARFTVVLPGHAPIDSDSPDVGTMSS